MGKLVMMALGLLMWAGVGVYVAAHMTPGAWWVRYVPVERMDRMLGVRP